MPLRHQCYELAPRGQMGEIGDRHLRRAYLAVQLPDFLMRQLEKIIEQAELCDDIKRRWMNRVAAKITEEVLVLLQYDRVDSRSCEQVAEDDARRAAAGHTAGRPYGAHRAFRVRSGSGLAEHQHEPVGLAEHGRQIGNLLARVFRFTQRIALAYELQATRFPVLARVALIDPVQ